MYVLHILVYKEWLRKGKLMALVYTESDLNRIKSPFKGSLENRAYVHTPNQLGASHN